MDSPSDRRLEMEVLANWCDIWRSKFPCIDSDSLSAFIEAGNYKLIGPWDRLVFLVGRLANGLSWEEQCQIYALAIRLSGEGDTSGIYANWLMSGVDNLRLASANSREPIAKELLALLKEANETAEGSFEKLAGLIYWVLATDSLNQDYFKAALIHFSNTVTEKKQYGEEDPEALCYVAHCYHFLGDKLRAKHIYSEIDLDSLPKTGDATAESVYKYLQA